MDEEKKEESTTINTGEGMQPKADGMLKNLFEENNRTEQLQKEGRELLNAQKEFYARQKIGGVTQSGQNTEQPQKTELEIKKEGAKEFFKGTQLEAAIDKL